MASRTISVLLVRGSLERSSIYANLKMASKNPFVKNWVSSPSLYLLLEAIDFWIQIPSSRLEII